MNNQNKLSWFILIFCVFTFSSTDVLSGSNYNRHETHEPQNVQKLESGRINQLKEDADLRGRTEENKGNFNKNVPRGAGVVQPPAKIAEPSLQSPNSASAINQQNYDKNDAGVEIQEDIDPKINSTE
ncbi:hypothetical protein [Nitrosomonas supralitoralis]|uniref:Uncharacterized protein n=1 Tax=Nitrosomonas supralitoralis TaxID=2116706 RepID=A0A2P7NQV6_9PROT|nr:hypothetical protein [Nitrosomonas supralitoralis]PSJ15845.1 hypothetical protein C7H79_16785 [Nitrosomonas supralitoralis]